MKNVREAGTVNRKNVYSSKKADAARKPNIGNGNNMESMKTAIEFEQLSIVADLTGGKRYIVHDLSFCIHEKERLAIVGESGSGKTMTAMALFGLLPENCHAAGKILYQSRNVLTMREREIERMRGKEFVLMPQSGADFLNPSLKVRYQVYETLRKCGIEKRNLAEKASELLGRVGFSDPASVLNKYPFQLSGGMAQRVVLAIGLASDSKVVVCDEPTRGVDDETSILFLDALYASFSESAILVITHNIAVASRCDYMLVMLGGELMEYGPVPAVLNSPSHPYTKSLIGALPENHFAINEEQREYHGAEIAGEECVFAKRCPVAAERCFKEKPALIEHNSVLRRCYQC